MKKLTFLVLAFFFFVTLNLSKGAAHAATISGGTIDLPETGQTTCHDVAGNFIAYAGTGQDGAIGVGVPIARIVLVL